MITRIGRADEMPHRAKSRLAAALRGAPMTPTVAGLTFVPGEVLAATVPGCTGLAGCLLDTAEAIGLDFVFVPGARGWAQEVVRADRKTAAMWVTDGPLWRTLSEMPSVSEGLALTSRDPRALTPGLDRESRRAAETMRLGLSLHADAVVIAEDLAGHDGLLFNPAFLRDHILPRFAELIDLAGTTPVLLHSDGDIGPVLPLLAQVGFAGVHAGGGLDRDQFEKLYWEARRAGLVVVGGIQIASLDRGMHAAIRAGTHAALLAQSGGLLVADDGGISTVEEMGAYTAALGAVRGGARKPVKER